MTRTIESETLVTLEHVEAEQIFDDMTRRMLEPLLSPIMRWLEIEEIEEIAINRPGEIWLKLRYPKPKEPRWVSRADGALRRQRLEDIITALANINGTPDFGPAGVPVVFGTLPGGHRFAGGVGPNFQYVSGEKSPHGTIVFTARQFRPNMPIRLEHFGLRPDVLLEGIDSDVARKSDARYPMQRILQSMKRGDHILVSGATSTGKTTFLNHLIRMMSPDLRIVTVEDTSEISIQQPNHLHILLDRSATQVNRFDYKSVVDLIVRLTPDVVMAGEISTTNASAIWELMRTGHGHFLTTIHAESPDEAISSFITRIGRADGMSVGHSGEMARDMRERLRVVQIKFDREAGSRRITHVV